MIIVYSDLSPEAKPFIPVLPVIQVLPVLPVIIKKFKRTRKSKKIEYYRVKENVVTKFITNPFDMPDLFEEYRFKE